MLRGARGVVRPAIARGARALCRALSVADARTLRRLLRPEEEADHFVIVGNDMSWGQWYKLLELEGLAKDKVINFRSDCFSVSQLP